MIFILKLKEIDIITILLIILLVTSGVSIGVIARSIQIQEELFLEIEDYSVIIDELSSKLQKAGNLNRFLEEEVEKLEDDYYLLEVEYDNIKRSVEKSSSTSRGIPRRVLLGTFEATAYCACTKCCGANAKGITASGTIPKEGRTIAVDPKIIPLGSKVSVDGKVYIAEDTGSAIKGNIIDIYYEKHEDALQFGRQKVEIGIVK